jgi:class 3 adenylate cyclase
LWDSDHPDYLTVGNHCLYSLTVYPTAEFQQSHESTAPLIYAAFVAGTFLLMIAAFVGYDLIVQRRNQKLVQNAARSNAIVTSLFPTNVRDRVVAQGKKDTETTSPLKGGMQNAPIADLHLESTIMFADVVGFTAWSSVREPVQVFTLLETLYGAFDKIAERRRVFKVETVGDCYVAATGIPIYQKDHATTMVRFASDVMLKMNILVKELEVRLGPDTGDLSLRIGIHSGPITAGVLRGQRSRFQLFGDTMNTTARIESSSLPGKIHISSETVEFLVRDGKGHWVEKRHGLVTAKGKGSLQTYWLRSFKGKHSFGLDERDGGSNSTTDAEEQSDIDLTVLNEDHRSEKTCRLIEWNTETLLNLVKQIVARRSTNHSSSDVNPNVSLLEKNQSDHPLEEVQEIITLPEYDATAINNQKNSQNIDLGEAVTEQIRLYVTCIARMYRNNAFHNFEHASHVTMSVTKLLSRIVAPKDIEDDKHDKLHDHTYGITSDPLTQFACAFSALIHDVDHMGVPNAQLVKENHPITATYNSRSVAEQYSLTVSWNLLMEDQFKDFRRCLYTTDAELMRFRHLVVNGVMATDIADKDLKNLRNARWAKAFDDDAVSSIKKNQSKADVDRKATIVIEHLIQASDIAHTMQHWHVYRKWNERLFTEMYQAFLDGRAEKDPSTFWYEGEIGFFDFYILPLAKKLKDCGVFGISSDEYLNYALNNREEWERRGQDVVAQMMKKVPLALVANPRE